MRWYWAHSQGAGALPVCIRAFSYTGYWTCDILQGQDKCRWGGKVSRSQSWGMALDCVHVQLDLLIKNQTSFSTLCKRFCWRSFRLLVPVSRAKARSEGWNLQPRSRYYSKTGRTLCDMLKSWIGFWYALSHSAMCQFMSDKRDGIPQRT